MTKNRQVLLASRPDGAPSASFEFVESDIPTPGRADAAPHDLSFA